MAVFSVNNLRPSYLPSPPQLLGNRLRSFSNTLLPYFDGKQPKNSRSNPAAVPPISSVSSADLDVHQTPASTRGSSSGWAKFSDNVSGEWDGFGADFTAEGKPIELPENVVPEAYREWEVKVFDWQTQCPTLAQTESGSHLISFIYKSIKLLPTVGCEADAATRFAVQERCVTNASSECESFPFAYQSSGCYVALWPPQPISMADYRLMELEHCLIDPQDKESRVRIIQLLEAGNSELKLRQITVFVEQWYGPFRNGDQLGGCAIRDSAFAATQPLEASQVSVVWQGAAAVAAFDNTRHHSIEELRGVSVRKSVRDVDSIVLLPKQLWCSVQKTEDLETCCEAGWLLSPGHAITSKCTFSNSGELKEIAVATETIVPL
ncbi:uncharacterized protein LOC127260589 [Andrographis paniculata]|uniref:uncharacterized protein LOC127260589 n=1 Tax=Andrographis paniculata TaxID=175694 RepID=UPI0021E8B850|nr:uncharacterized protein LOC127260589 [Andrographis paniculata]